MTKDDINNTDLRQCGHVEIVQGASMLLAEHVTWNQTTDIVIATGDVKLIDDQGNINFSDYLEITDDMRQAFMKKRFDACWPITHAWSAGRREKDGNVTTINRGIFSPCELCKDRSDAATDLADQGGQGHSRFTDSKRIYYHDATFEVDGVPVAWTPYFLKLRPHRETGGRRAGGRCQAIAASWAAISNRAIISTSRPTWTRCSKPVSTRDQGPLDRWRVP